MCAVLEIPKGIEPNWEAAREHVKSLTEIQLAGVISELNDLGADVEDEDEFEEIKKDYDLEKFRKEVLEAVEFCDWMWDGNASGTRLYLRNCAVLICGGSSWGDPVDGVREMSLFDLSGAAKAAGFLGSVE